MTKLEALSQIDPAMPNPKKLKHLISGLPQSIAVQMTLALDPQTTTPNKFLNRLRAYIKFKLKSPSPAPPPNVAIPNANIRPFMEIKVTPPVAMLLYTPRPLAPTRQCD
jgi:hypothetical protein